MPTTTARVHGVFAATGKQGGATAAALLDRGERVRVLVRRPESAEAQALQARGAEVVLADLDRPETLVPAMQGLSTLWFMTLMLAEPGAEAAMGRSVGDAAVAAGIEHVVFSSVGGAERDSGVPHFESKYAVENHLRGLSVRTTAVRPVFFMENLPFLATVEDGAVLLRLPLPGDVPLQLISVRDIGRVAAAALLDPDLVPDGAIEVAGDELTGDQIAAALGRAAGLPARYQAQPLDVVADDPDSHAMFAWFAELPAYRADMAATDALAGGALSLTAWLSATGWQPSS